MLNSQQLKRWLTFVIDDEITQGILVAENNINIGHGEQANLPFSARSKNCI